jgi:hypothetical protein
MYIHTGGVRNDGTQYYLDRNIVIQPSNPPSGNVSVRYYFLDTEAANLIGATGCPICTTIPDAFQAGVTQYSSPIPAEEDNTLANNAGGTYLFHRPHQDVSIIPYDNGYYAEYQVTGFSEFWINNGGPTLIQPLPLVLLSFTATKTDGTSALLQWSTSHEVNVSRFIIEKSNDGSHFSDLDSVPASGNTPASGNSSTVNYYRYTDPHLLPGQNYYRLRMTDLDGHFTWSPIRTVNDAGGGPGVSIYPNPISRNGNLYISTSVNCERIQLADVSGRVILQADVHGLWNTLPVGALARGVYFITVVTEAGKVVQKVLVE